MSSVSGCGGFSAANLEGAHASRADRAQQLFAKLDVNKDGAIDSGELKSLTDYIGKSTGTTVDADALLKAIDTNGDGSISSTELGDNTRKLFDNLRAQLTAASGTTDADSAAPDVSELFASLDSNGDGSLSADEFKAGAQRGPMGPPTGHGHGAGHIIGSLLESYGATSAVSSSSLEVAA